VGKVQWPVVGERGQITSIWRGVNIGTLAPVMFDNSHQSIALSEELRWSESILDRRSRMVLSLAAAVPYIV
jgi:hypothetical protein